MLIDLLRDNGVVGAGGAGFPTYVKAQAQVEYMLANGAECEPLLHKDFELMKNYPGETVAGMVLMMEATGARKAKYGIKEKNRPAIDAVAPIASRHGIELVLLGDFYPSGDEYELVYTATGRLIPAAGIPLQVGCVVNNVETLYNVHQASQGKPVTQKFLSVAGAVRNPSSFWVPVGTSFGDVIRMAGGAAVDDFAFFISGIMMGTLSTDLDEVVSKTTGGLIVLPADHYLVTRKSQPQQARNKIGKSACDQCSYCTEFCPRYLLGYEVVPHKVMRTLGFTLSGKEHWAQWGELCCACGLCTLYACPEDLFPKEACDDAKRDLRVAGIKFTQQQEVRVHPMKEYRRVPLHMLRKRLKVEEYEGHTPLIAPPFQPSRVRLKMKQHAGQPASPAVSPGDSVEVGTVVGRVDRAKLGCDVHASIAGVVTAVNENYVEVEAR